MQKQEIFDQVQGFLDEQGVSFGVFTDRHAFVVPVPGGSAEVHIDFRRWADGMIVIAMHSDVLVGVNIRDEARAGLLEQLNVLNRDEAFGTFYFDDERSAVVLRYDLLGDELDPAELKNALDTVGVLADRTDDELMNLLGTGKRAQDVDDGDREGLVWIRSEGR